MSKLSLYNITEEYLQIIALVEQADGELSPELEEALSINQEDLEIKCTNYFGVVKEYEGGMALIDKEIERLSAIRQQQDRAYKRLKTNLLNAVLLFGEENPKTKVKSLNFGTFKLSTRRNPKVVIEDEDSVEHKYCDFSVALKKLTRKQMEEAKSALKIIGFETITDNSTISKTRIKADILAIKERNKLVKNEDEAEEESVSGAYYEENNFSLTIK